MNKIGEKIRECRTSKGLTLGNLGEKIGLSAQTIQKYETGAIENVSVQTLTKIARALEVSPAYLMGWEEEKTANIVESAENKIVNALLTATKENKITWHRLGIITTQSNNSDLYKEIREAVGNLLYSFFNGHKELRDIQELNTYFVGVVSNNIYVLQSFDDQPYTPDVVLNILRKQTDNRAYNHQIDSFQTSKLIDLYRLINDILLEQENKPLFDILSDLEKL